MFKHGEQMLLVEIQSKSEQQGWTLTGSVDLCRI